MISGKDRHMVVVHVHDRHYIALPMYTHSGRGLEHLSASTAIEYMSVLDHRFTGVFKNQSTHRPLQTNFMHPAINVLLPQSVLHVAYPVCRQFRIPVLVEGNLSPASTSALRNFWTQLNSRNPIPHNLALPAHGRGAGSQRVQGGGRSHYTSSTTGAQQNPFSAAPKPASNAPNGPGSRS